MQAELDPSSLARLAEDVAHQLGVTPDVARRIVESELGIPPLLSTTRAGHRSTRVDFPPVENGG